MINMSIIKDNPLLKGISGKLGSIVFRQCGDKIVLAKRPTKSKKVSPRQQENRARFGDAVRYANAQVSNPISKAEYAKGINAERVSAYAVAVADFLHAPVISGIYAADYHGAVGDIITIKAYDDFRVTSVIVSISNGEGGLIEMGEAVPCDGIHFGWRYVAKVANTALRGTRIGVAATDRPGNITIAERVV